MFELTVPDLYSQYDLVSLYTYSAADLYIKDFLDPYVEDGHPEARPLRIYYRQRWINTVSPTVQKYCLIGEQYIGFRKPTKEDILSHRVIVATLSTSRYLYNLRIEGSTFNCLHQAVKPNPADVQTIKENVLHHANNITVALLQLV